MTLDFLTFQTEGNFDYVFVYDGVSTSAPTLLSTSGSSTPSDQSSSGSSLLVEFMSDYSVTGDGFSANWESHLFMLLTLNPRRLRWLTEW